MSFIDPGSNVRIHAKLTSAGRRLLASGALTFDSWAFGDSEIDYRSDAGTRGRILRPFDNHPPLKHRIARTAGGEGYNVADASNFSSFEKRLTNTAPERGMFTGSTLTGYSARTTTDITIQPGAYVDSADVTGTAVLRIRRSASHVPGSPEPVAGDLLMVAWRTPARPGSGSTLINRTQPAPHLFYKVQSLTGSLSADTLSVTVDRTIPNFGGAAGARSLAVFYPGQGSIGNFFAKPGPLSGGCATSAPSPVWNLSIVRTEDLCGLPAGFQTLAAHATSGYTGFKSYTGLAGDLSQKSIGIIHYSSPSTFNEYGEYLVGTTPTIDLPTLMWHRSTGSTMGLTLTCDPVRQLMQLASGSTTPYHNLVAGDGLSTVVGRCYPDLKLMVVTDEELLAAMSYKSNRNWTLPPLGLGLWDAPGSSESPVLTTPVQKLYVTYLLDNTPAAGLGFAPALPCQTYLELTAPADFQSRGVAMVSFTAPPRFMAGPSGLAAGTGYTASSLKILVQRVENPGDRPLPGAWKMVDVTGQLPSSGGAALSPDDLLPSRMLRITGGIYDVAPVFVLPTQLGLPTVAEADRLQFGDEEFLYGNVKAAFGASVYRSDLTCTAMPSEFNQSQNPTWRTGDAIAITEVGIYNAGRDLVAVAKLSAPYRKNPGTGVVIIQVSIDF